MKKLLSLLLALAVAFAIPAGSGLYVADAATDGIAISTADDLKAMEKNPSGSYYLANDIEVPANLILFTDYDHPFTGTLDGRGHKLKGYTYSTNEEWVDDVALFVYTKKATIKNLSMTDVDIRVNNSTSAAGLISSMRGGTVSNVSVSGKITGKYLRRAGGIVGDSYGGGTLTGCNNSADITVTGAAEESYVAGVAGFLGSGASVKNCSNSGRISISGNIREGGFYAAGIVTYADKATSCSNSGTVTVSATGSGQQIEACTAAGVAGEVKNGVSCSNTGKVNMNAAIQAVDQHKVGGAFASVTKLASKCYNKGAVSYSGKSSRGICVGGVSGTARKISQSYNKGSVTVKIPSAKSAEQNEVGGVCGLVTDMRNCYNTGSVTATGAVYAGGISGYANPWDDKVVCNYSTGKIKASTKGSYKGQIIGGYNGTEVVQKRNIYNNYYTGSGGGYAPAYSTQHKYAAKASKVSSITAGNCPKLSSKYWTYSGKYKRLILKNNKEK